MWLLDNLDVVILGVVGSYLVIRLETLSRRLRGVEFWIVRMDPNYSQGREE